MSNGRSVIDGAKCKNCKLCIAQCPYNAIVKIIVPCEDACPVDAIVKDANGFVQIDYGACLSCGKCIMNCPFGAIHEKSQIIHILKHIKSGGRVIALIAPSIVGQFPGGVYRLKTAMLKAGFADVYEVAQGADTTIRNEAREFAERMEAGAPFMTTSCCAGYSQFIKKHLPGIRDFVSDTKTPLYYIAEKVRRDEPSALTVFISPCVAKKNEALTNPDIDFVMNYEELGALLIARNIEILDCEEAAFDQESSKQGRNFGVSGGVAEAVASIAKGQVRPCVINGLDKTTIKLLKKMAQDRKCEEGNLVEVMCCENGCIGGNATICPPKTARTALAKFCADSPDLTA
jgi:iron only hydrogenase large subunit-like protein